VKEKAIMHGVGGEQRREMEVMPNAFPAVVVWP
jgi:hypothetical protein